MAAVEGVEITGPGGDRYDEILTPDSSHVALLPVMITSWARIADGGTDANARP